MSLPCFETLSSGKTHPSHPTASLIIWGPEATCSDPLPRRPGPSDRASAAVPALILKDKGLKRCHWLSGPSHWVQTLEATLTSDVGLLFLLLPLISSLFLLPCVLRTHLQDLKEVTHNIHYETYRAKRLNDNGGLPPVSVDTEESHDSNP